VSYTEAYMLGQQSPYISTRLPSFMLAGVSPLAVMSEGGRVLMKELVVAADCAPADAADGVFTGHDSLSSGTCDSLIPTPITAYPLAIQQSCPE